jgi:hypothetical protein
MAGPAQRALLDEEIERLRAAKKVVGIRAHLVFRLRTTMPPPQHGAGSTPPRAGA